MTRTADRHNKMMQTLKVHQKDHTVHWKAYGKGVANIQFDAAIQRDGTPFIQIDASETMLARENYDQKRDVEKRVMITLYGNAGLELYEMLKEVFEPAVAPKAGV